MAPFTVLIPLDGSEFSREIIPYICRLIVPRDYRVILLRVEPPQYGYLSPAPRPFIAGGLVAPQIEVVEEYPDLARHAIFASQVEARVHAAAIAGMEPDVHDLEDAGYAVVARVRFGEPAEEIVAAAQEEGADLVAMTTRGHGNLPGLNFGSVASAVLRHSHLPVLMLNPEVALRQEEISRNLALEPA